MFKRIFTAVHARLPKAIRQRLGEDEHSMELLEGSAGSLLARAGSFVSTYILTLTIAWVYGADELGIFSIATTVILLAAMVGTLGLDSALLRLIARHRALGQMDVARGHYKNAIIAAVPASIIIAISLYLSSAWLATNIFGKPELAGALRVSALVILPFALLSIVTAAIQSLKRPALWSLLHPAGTVHTLVAAALLLCSAILPFNHATILTYGMGVVLALIISILIWRSLSKGGPTTTTSMPVLLRISLPMLLTSAFFFILIWIDTLMLGVIRTSAEVGVYNAAARMAMLTAFALTSINAIAAPKFSELHTTNIHALKQIIHKSNAIVFWSSLPVLLALALFPRQILGIFGPEFISGSSALVILVAGQFINAVSGSVGILLNMTGHHKQFQRIVLVAVCINVTLNFLFIPTMGITGAALATSISTMVWNLGSVIYIHRKFGIVTIYLPWR